MCLFAFLTFLIRMQVPSNFLADFGTYGYSYYGLSYPGVSVSPVGVYVKGNVDDAVSGSFSGTITRGTGPFHTPSIRTYSVSVPSGESINTSAFGEYTKINSISKSHSVSGTHGSVGAKITASFNIKEAEPYTSEFLSTASLKTTYTMPSGDLYLIVKPNGGTVDIKGESFDVSSDVFFRASGLPPDTAYKISKNEIPIVVGKTNAKGEIFLRDDDVDYSSSSGGILKMYPESGSYIGPLGAALIDMYHKESVPLSAGENLVYIPQNYVRWVFPVPVEVENMRVDNLQLDYLNGNYSKNDALVIPVIPSADTIYATINGTDTEVLMRDVSVHTQIKQVLKKSSSSSDSSTSGTVATSSNISTSTFLTATHTGTAIANVDLTVGGSAAFSLSSNYAGEFVEKKNMQ